MYHEASLALILGDRSQEPLSIMTVMCAAMSNMCRDEITGILKTKLDIVFGSSFNTNGLGGVLTCGVTGVKAGLSHSPISAVGSRSLCFGTASPLTASCTLFQTQGDTQETEALHQFEHPSVTVSSPIIERCRTTHRAVARSGMCF